MQYYPQAGVKKTCGLFGKTRQAWYVRHWSEQDISLRDTIVIKEVKQIRAEQPRVGTRKLHSMLCATLEQHSISIGRDKLFDLLAEHGLLVRRRKRRHINTTDSNHPFRRYPNLIRDLQVTGPNQLWVSDITYISLIDGFCYLSLVTDAYSRKIVGYCLSDTLKKEGTLQALQMALDDVPDVKSCKLIHHSDRGLQYCCADYIDKLTLNRIYISMTEKGDPYENAIAERVNGILKSEFGLGKGLFNFSNAKAAVDNAIAVYNMKRLHGSCDNLTPHQAHQRIGALPIRWKRKFVNTEQD
jgi:putative transposase